jgi:enoyl-CoA hydratase/carnithine racemase
VGITRSISEHVAEVVIDVPPVNALPSSSWLELASLVRSAGEDEAVRAVIVRAEGKGFCAGVDIKELQADPQAIVAVNRSCAEAFASVYECAVPVIAAVHGFCLGGGIGVVGNADVIVASNDAEFGLPEVSRGALGAATHLARLVPQHRMRAMFYTGERATAEELHAYGSVLRVVEPGELQKAARDVADAIAAQPPGVVRLAKEALNGIDPVDVRRSYRFEQGFTLEAHVRGEGDEARRRFLEET